MNRTSMTRVLLAGASALAIAIAAPDAGAKTWDFNSTGTWAVPATDVYEITAWGAQGGQRAGVPDGLGPEIGGRVILGGGTISRNPSRWRGRIPR